MKDLRFRRLEQYRVGGSRDQMRLSVPLPKSPSGKAYQYSPNPEASPRLFLIGAAPEGRVIPEEGAARMRRAPGPGETICPYSGYQGPDEEFTHFQDVAAVKKYIACLAGKDVQDWVSDFAKDFNRGQRRGGLISISMSAKPVHQPRPLAIREDLLRALECDVCARPYGVYALALFCPDCGAPNVALHFRREVALISEQIALADGQDEQGRHELAYRLMGNAHEDVLTAFEATLKTIYRYLVRMHMLEEAKQLTGKKAIGNAFQNIERGQALFDRLGIDPFAGLNEAEIDHLRLNIQKRHVLGHNLGMADQHFLQFAEDHEPGETIPLIGEDISHFGALCSRVIEALELFLLPGAALPDISPR